MSDSLAQIDLMYLAWNRKAFTEASLQALRENTDWSRVRRLYLYCDGLGQDDGTRNLMANFTLYVKHEPVYYEFAAYRRAAFGGPVAVMNHYLQLRSGADWFAKIDNDVVVPPGWLPECLRVLQENPTVDLLGIEPVHPPWPCGARVPEITDHIGGIGLMRTACFTELPVADGRMGFTQWQVWHPDIVKAWLNPGLPVILLDRLPFNPWISLSAKYEAKGWQRPWQRYTEADQAIWSWWKP